MALPYLPDKHITPVFEALCAKANSDTLCKLTDYIRQTWIYGKIRRPKCWSVFCQAVRTNNDVEGWHGKLNRHANKGNINFYLLAQLCLLYTSDAADE